MTTQSVNGKFPSQPNIPGFPGQDKAGSTQNGTDRATFPREIPITQGKRESLIIPPNFLTEPRPAWTEIRDYARYAPYLGGGNPVVRAAGQAYSYVAITIAGVMRLIEWIHERPARASIFWLMVFIGLAVFS